MTEPNGLVYMRARYYDSNVGRFISEDPAGFDGGDVNLMAYVGGNPIMKIDPLGQAGFDAKTFAQLTTSVTYYSTKFMKNLELAEGLLVDNALNAVGIATPVLGETISDYLGATAGKLVGGTFGAAVYNLMSPSKLSDPSLGKDGNWYYPNGKQVNGCSR
jgi:RHS repeat-associated protein